MQLIQEHITLQLISDATTTSFTLATILLTTTQPTHNIHKHTHTGQIQIPVFFQCSNYVLQILAHSCKGLVRLYNFGLLFRSQLK